MALTPKQQAFVDEYLIDLNATQAAIRAGYSPKFANSSASKILQNTAVRACIDTALAERSRRTGISADRVLMELARVAFVNAVDLIDMNSASLQVGASRDDTAVIQAVKVKEIPTPDGIGVEREIKLADKLRSLELLGKHLGMFTDNINITGNVGVEIVDDIRTSKDSS